jgi:DNA invertase Pin-like site-specific DNA recombinase
MQEKTKEMLAKKKEMQDKQREMQDQLKVFLKEAVAYLRYSTHNQDDGVSIEYQTQQIEEYAEKNGYKIVEWFIDKAASAKKVAGRNEFIRMFREVEAGIAPPTLIIFSTARAFRDATDSSIYREKLRKKGIKLLSVTQIIDDDTIGGRLVTDLMSRIDQYKIEETGEYVAASIKFLISQGFYAGGPIPYGYKTEEVMFNGSLRSKLVPREDEAKIVVDIFEAYISGKSLRTIAKSLNQQGIYQRSGKPFEPVTINYMLNNIIYTGTRIYNMERGKVINNNYCQPLVTKDQFNVAQNRFTKNKEQAQGRHRKFIYPATGLMRCTKCGGTMHGISSGNRSYYQCRNSYSTHSKCKSRLVRKDWLDPTVFNAIKENLLTPQAIKTITNSILSQIKKTPAIAEDKKTLLKRKKEISEAVSKLVNLMITGKITEEQFDENKAPLDDELASVDRKLSQIAASYDDRLNEDYIKNQIKSIFDSSKSFEECDDYALKDLFEQTVHSIEASDTQVVIHLRVPLTKYNFNDENGVPLFGLKLEIERPPIVKGRQKKKREE